jgi:HEAT repeat protein
MRSLVGVALSLVAGLGLMACTTTDQQVERGIEKLAANRVDSPAWNSAVDGLVAIGRPAARQLIAHLSPDQYKGLYYREYRDEQESIRTGAARALGHIRPRGAALALGYRVVTGYTASERIACIWAIGQTGFSPEGYDAVKAQLKDTDPLIRLHAAVAVTKMELEDGVPELESALAGTDEQLAGIALEGLQQSGYCGVPLLVRLAAGSSPRPEQLRAVLDAVRTDLVGRLNADDPQVRRRAATALGQIGDTSARGPLLARLSDASNLVRFNAAAALATMDDPDGIGFLFSALQSDDAILRANAVLFLTHVQRSSGAVESQLLQALRAASPLARAGGAQVLGQSGVTTAVDQLLEATRDGSPDVRRSAAIALGQIGAASSAPLLRELTNDADETVSYYAEWALARLGQG